MKHELNKAAVGKNVNRYRKRAGLTQAQLAEKAGCSSTYISSVECGTKTLSTGAVLSFAETLGVSCDALMREDGKGANAQNIIHLLSQMSVDDLTKLEALIRLIFCDEDRNTSENGIHGE